MSLHYASAERLAFVNSETLSHFEYHWFWGLIFNPFNIREGNLAVQAAQLAQDEPLLRSLQEQQRAVSQRPVLIQFIYRFFNIDDFAFNTYRLAVYEINREFMQLAQRKENMPNYWNTKKQAAGKNLQRAKNAIYKQLQPHLSRRDYLNRATEEIALVAVRISQHQPPELPDAGIGKQFMIKASMQPYLRQLGINRSEGDSLDWSDVRHAFFAKALLAHPDKNGSAESFRNIKNALDRLEQQIFCEQGENQQKYHTQWQDFFYEAYRKFDRTMTRVEAGIAVMKRETAEMKRETTEMKRETAEMKRKTAEMKRETAEMKRETAEMKRETAEMKRETAEMKRETAEMKRDIAEINRGIAALNEKCDKWENDLNKRILRRKEKEAQEYARQNDMSLRDELLAGPSSPSKVFSNPHCSDFFGSQPADQSQPELSLSGDSRVNVSPHT